MRMRTFLFERSSLGFCFLVAIVLVLLPMAGPAGCHEWWQSGNVQAAAKQAAGAGTVASGAAQAAGAPNLVTAVERVAKDTIPAVVHIEVTERQKVPTQLQPFMQDPFFHWFFGTPRAPQELEREVKAIGTGMIIDHQGHILTNYHVAGGATKIVVQLADGRVFPAKLVGGDPKTDLAVIRIKAGTKLPQVTFGDSDHVKVGEWVVAIGHPRGLNMSVTQGIISAEHRTGITNPSDYQDFLQTDAAINPGNSGGPLLTLQGKVIGINAAISSTSGGFQGIGFAIPSNMARYVARQILKYGEVRRGWLGVAVQDVTPELASAFNLKQIRGALVASVVKDSPAARARLRKGDVIIAFRDKPIADAASLRNAVATTPIGDQTTLTVIRNGQKKVFTVKIASLKKAKEMMTSSVEERLGARFRAISPVEARRFGIQPGQGVEITTIGKGPLAQAGFEKGDLILAVNNQPVGSPEALAALIRQVPAGQAVALLAMDHRTGRTSYVEVTPR